MDAHFLLAFCPCGFHGVYLYPVIAHMVKDCYTGHTQPFIVDADLYPEFLEAIRPFVKGAMVLAALSSGCYTLLIAAQQVSPIVKEPVEVAAPIDEVTQTEHEEEEVLPPKEHTGPYENPSRLERVKSACYGYRLTSFN